MPSAKWTVLGIVGFLQLLLFLSPPGGPQLRRRGAALHSRLPIAPPIPTGHREVTTSDTSSERDPHTLPVVSQTSYKTKVRFNKKGKEHPAVAAYAPYAEGDEEPSCRSGKLLFLKTKPHYLICVYPVAMNDLISLTLMDKGVWPECAAFWRSALKLHGDVSGKFNVLDIGANIGSCSLYFAANGATVHSFEPLEFNYELLESSISINHFKKGSVTLYKYGASNEEGESKIAFEESNHGNSIVLSGDGDEERNGNFKVATVKLKRIDDTIPPFIHFRMLKIDCQGHEYKALKGAKLLLSEGRVDMVVFEVDRELLAKAGSSPAELFALLYSHGFTIKSPTGSQVSPNGANEYARNGNYIAFLKKFDTWADGRPLYPIG